MNGRNVSKKDQLKYIIGNLVDILGIVTKVTPIETISHDVFILRGEKGVFVLKLLSEDIFIFRKKQEVQIIDYFFGIGITPNLIHSDYKTYMLFSYQAGDTLDKVVINEPIIKSMGSVVAKIHKAKINDVVISNNSELCSMHLKHINKNDKIIHEALNISEDLFDKINGFRVDFGFVHYDLNLKNFIWTTQKTLYVIDFEYSSMNDVYIDIATIYGILPKDQFKLFIEHYKKDGNFQLNKKKLHYYCILSKFLDVLWLVRYGYYDLAQEALQKMKVLVKSSNDENHK